LKISVRQSSGAYFFSCRYIQPRPLTPLKQSTVYFIFRHKKILPNRWGEAESRRAISNQSETKFHDMRNGNSRLTSCCFCQNSQYLWQ